MIKSIFLKGVEVKIGDSIRFINDIDLYTEDYDGYDKIIKPKIGTVYTVRGFTESNGFFLEEIKNDILAFTLNGVLCGAEPGFASWRFDPGNPLFIEVIESAKSKKRVNIIIDPEVIERSEEILEFSN